MYNLSENSLNINSWTNEIPCIKHKTSGLTYDQSSIVNLHSHLTHPSKPSPSSLPSTDQQKWQQHDKHTCCKWMIVQINYIELPAAAETFNVSLSFSPRCTCFPFKLALTLRSIMLLFNSKPSFHTSWIDHDWRGKK